MRHYTVVANWKMYMGPAEAKQFMTHMNNKVVQHTHVTSVVCPPAISIQVVSDLAEPDVVRVGAQNLNAGDEGAFTGEISGPMIKQLADFVIVGHSERRKHYHETDADVAAKLAAAVRNNLKPILCVGENLIHRNQGIHKRVVVDQLHGALKDVTADDLSSLLVAYEPVWAIGTGQFAKPEQVDEMTITIRQTLEELFGENASSQIGLLYGGSVTPDDCKAYLQLQHIDGLLVGHDSINYQHFASIIKIAQFLASKT